MNRAKTARELALDVLIKVEKDKAYSHLQLNQSLKNVNLDRKDMNFATEIIYGTLQHLNTIDWILTPFLKTDLNRLEIWVKNLLRLSIYQIWYLDRVPDHAIVHEAVEIAKKMGHKGIAGMVNGILRNLLRQKKTLQIPEHASVESRMALEHSHPEWLVKRWMNDFGIEATEEICKANNIPPYHSVRVNPLKISRDEMILHLRNELGEEAEVTPSSLSEQGIRIKGGGNLAFSRWYSEGYITIQDESSMLVAKILDPKPGMKVLDAAAAPGGKTTHIAELMKDQGEILAVDIHQHKIELIEKQQKRLHLHIIKTLLSDARKIQNQIDESFDRILLDVPCSGLGVIRRKPDLKWYKIEEDIQELSRIQTEILEQAASLLKPNGVLVYSTCTMAIEENQNRIKDFIQKHPDFELDSSLPTFLSKEVNEKLDASSGMIQILPQHFHTDGFFISRLVKRKGM